VTAAVDSDCLDGCATCQRKLTAYHEAGHAVAAVMRGGGELLAITIEGTDDYAGKTWTRAKVFDAAFLSFAGPWAEARAQWPMRTLDGKDRDGCVFGDYLTAAWLHNCDGDGERYEEHLAAEAEMYGDHVAQVCGPQREDGWTSELAQHWSVIRAVAKLLVAGKTLDHDTVDGLLQRHSQKLTTARVPIAPML
jgi:hypothetical protein